ncbi:hypothetical protein DAEQUDRAFT_279812 [Daedalea quercina L-15889]|uniref:Uncharacterized protein n=1 Tax=Daedalea quercina L-15889 TaxID=1314783 RepID=A0A165Q8S2_9APHY|nr:hypothetical protein DAEQUDRAFT_279812 [Daedalea quercina L-15889]
MRIRRALSLITPRDRPRSIVQSCVLVNPRSGRRSIHAQTAQQRMDLVKDDDRYKCLVCPRHRPIARPRHPLLFPPELLIPIFVGIASDYLYFLFSSETQDDDDIEARLALNPFRAILQVSHQFREIALLKVFPHAFGIHGGQDGTLPNDPWACLRFVLKHVHLLQRGTPEAVEEHVKGGSTFEVPPLLQGYLQIAKLTRAGRSQTSYDGVLSEGAKSRELLASGSKASVMLQPAQAAQAFAVLWCLQVRLSLLSLVPLRLVPLGDDRADLILRVCYGKLYVMAAVQHVSTALAKQLDGKQPLVPIPVPMPPGLNADQVNRFSLVWLVWQFRGCPIVAADKGLMEMTESLLDRSLAISIPDRPLTSKTAPRRRASFSAVQDLQAKPRPPYRPSCRCERRLWVV